MKVIKEEWNQANVEYDGNTSTQTDHLESMSSGSQPVLMQKSLAEKLQTPMRKVVHDALVQGIELLDDISIGETSFNEQLECVQGEWIGFWKNLICIK